MELVALTQARERALAHLALGAELDQVGALDLDVLVQVEEQVGRVVAQEGPHPLGGGAAAVGEGPVQVAPVAQVAARLTQTPGVQGPKGREPGLFEAGQDQGPAGLVSVHPAYHHRPTSRHRFAPALAKP